MDNKAQVGGNLVVRLVDGRKESRRYAWPLRFQPSPAARKQALLAFPRRRILALGLTESIVAVSADDLSQQNAWHLRAGHAHAAFSHDGRFLE